MKKIFLLFIFVTTALFSHAQTVADGEHKETDGFMWTLRTVDGIKEVSDANGNVIIPLDRGYTDVKYISVDKKESKRYFPFFKVYIKFNKDTTFVGACSKDGKEVIQPAFKNIQGVIVKKLNYYLITHFDDYEGACDTEGRFLVLPRYKRIRYNGNHFNLDGTTDFVFHVSNDIAFYNEQQAFLDKALSAGVSIDKQLEDAEKMNNNDAIDKLTEAIKIKPSAIAYCRRGQCYYNREKWKDAQSDLRMALFLSDATPIVLSTADSLLIEADEKRLDQLVARAERARAISAALNGLASSLNSMSQSISNSRNSSGGQTGSYSSMPTTYYNTGSSNNNNSISTGNSSNNRHINKVCRECQGDGKCRAQGRGNNVHCLGTGKCRNCNGQGTLLLAGSYSKCSSCNGSGRCSFCGGSGVCATCRGTGHK